MPRSPLHDAHLALGARLVPFAGWEMPIQYEGIVAEHRAVREGVGIFDISHMGEFEVSGTRAGSWLNGLLTNDVAQLDEGEGQYTLLLDEDGGVIDDLILYRAGEDRFFLVVNAARTGEDFAWFSGRAGEGVTLTDRSGEFGAVAVQGPGAAAAWERVLPGRVLPPRNGITEDPAEGWIACRTGYTGEDGFEFFAPADRIGDWFARFREAGAVPCGLGARDTLRLEKCYPLNGSDLDRDHTPIEAGLKFFVALDKEGGFTGREVLARQAEEGVATRLSAISMTGKAPPPRAGYVVRERGGDAIATLTSGSLSPTLGRGIGLAYLPVEASRPGTELEIVVRDRPFPAEVVKKPFL